jgi:PiT family inorganic phosphate transporter
VAVSLDVFFIVFASVIGFLMAWGVGANDLANIMSTTMGSKAVSVRQAIMIAVVFEFAGAFLGGGHVTNTIRTGIINTALVTPPDFLIYGMLAILIAGMVWMSSASYLGMPVSVTNAVVGALVGFGLIVLGPSTVHWDKVKTIAISWVSSPVAAGTVAFLLFITIKRSILSQASPAQAVRRYAPLYLFLIGLIFAVMIVLKGLAHFDIHFHALANLGIMVVTALFVLLVGGLVLRRVENTGANTVHDQLIYVEKIFGVLMGLTACAMVFAHGSNDVAIAVGPIAAVIGLAQHGNQLSGDMPIPAWSVLLGCVGVVSGLLMYGRKVIETVGSQITALTPSRAFAATFAAAATVIVSTSSGIPVSATQTLVGAVLGVGLARGIGALNLGMIRNIFMSWIVTLPVAAGLAVFFFYVLKFIFYHAS